MKFKDFMRILKSWEAHGSYFNEFEVCIPASEENSCGATPCVPVKDVLNGVDWDDKKIFIHPEIPLTKSNT